MFKFYPKAILGLLFLSISSLLFSQNIGINTNGATPSTNAILDLNSGNSRNLGFIIPNVTLGASLSTFNPPMAGSSSAKDNGMMVYNTGGTQTVGYYYWNQTLGTWTNAGGGASGNVSACGTAALGYIPYFTPSSSVICNSDIFQFSTTLVGIGTTTPKSMLDVVGATGAGAMAIGAGTNTAGTGYAGTTKAPTNGAIIEGQVGMGIAAVPATSALDVYSTSMGFEPPSVASTASVTTPVNGLIVYNTTTLCLEYYVSSISSWIDMACGCVTVGVFSGATNAITGSTPVCESGGAVFTTAVVAGATYYTWTMTGGTFTGQSSNSITATTFTATGTQTVTVVAGNACGVSATTKTFTFTVDPPITGTLSNPGTACSSASTNINLTGLTATSYTSIVWSAGTDMTNATNVVTANAGAGSTTLVLNGGTGGTDVVTATLTGVCGSLVLTSTVTVSSLPSATISQASTQFCAPGPDAVTLSAAANYTSITWTAPTAICSASIVTAATTANATTLNMDGGTNNGSGVATATLTNLCGSVTYSTTTIYAGDPTGATTVTGNTSPSLSTAYTYTCTSIANATGYTWTVSNAADATITSTSGNTAVITTTSTTGTFTICATPTNSCGNGTQACLTVTSINCSGTITQDPNASSAAASGLATKTLTIKITDVPDLIIISCNGYNASTATWNGSVAYAGAASGSATEYAFQSGTGSRVGIAYYWIAATVAGTYNITVTESTSYTDYANYGIALTGFCSTPTSADIVYSNYSAPVTADPMTATLTESAGSYAIGSSVDRCSGGANITWTGITSLFSTQTGGTSNANYGFAGKAIAAAASPATITASDADLDNDGHNIIYLIDIK
jgi:hypothetical protein